MKGGVTVALLLFVAVSVGYMVASEARRPAAGALVSISHPTDKAPAPAPARPVRAVAYYFHGTMRCPTCLKMEQYAREAIEERFGAEIHDGVIEWRPVNYDEPPNEHFVKKFGLSASALVLESAAKADTQTSRKLDRIWDLVGDETSFKAYVAEEMRVILRSAS